MEPHVQFSELFGHSEQQKAFYFMLFQKLFRDGLVYSKEVTGWNKKSQERWRSNLIRNEVVEMHRGSFGGAVYYTFHPQFIANCHRVLKVK